MIQPAVFLNLFFVPTLAVYLHYKRLGAPLKPSLRLLFQYCITASFNYALARVLLMILQLLSGSSHSVDSAHYTLAALFAAWLLPQLYKVAGKIRVELDFTRLGSGGKPAEQISGSEEEPHHEEANKR